MSNINVPSCTDVQNAVAAASSAKEAALAAKEAALAATEAALAATEAAAAVGLALADLTVRVANLENAGLGKLILQAGAATDPFYSQTVNLVPFVNEVDIPIASGAITDGDMVYIYTRVNTITLSAPQAADVYIDIGVLNTTVDRVVIKAGDIDVSPIYDTVNTALHTVSAGQGGGIGTIVLRVQIGVGSSPTPGLTATVAVETQLERLIIQ